MKPHRVKPHPRGFVLLIVLWVMAMLALLGTRLTATTRAQLRLASDSRDQAAAEAAADAGLRQAMFVLLGKGRIGSAEQPTRIRVGPAVVDLVATDEATRINPNTVSRDVLRGLLAALEVDPPLAARLSAEITDWRVRSQISILGGPKITRYHELQLPYRSGDHAFYSVDELALVPDMTPEILERLRPWLSVYHEGEVSDPLGVSPAAAAVGDARASSRSSPAPGFVSRNVILRLTATATVHASARFIRSAVVRLREAAADPPSKLADLIQVLTWE